MRTLQEMTCGTPVKIIVGIDTEKRLSKTCFRGRKHLLAGNFKLWDNAQQLFSDQLVMRELMQQIESVFTDSREVKSDYGEWSFTITYPHFVGWSGTDDIAKYFGSQLKVFKPNKRSIGFIVDRGNHYNRDIRAPLTNEITIIFQLINDGGAIVALIRSIYPGKDMGDLVGNVSKREKRVFFDWNHPGRKHGIPSKTKKQKTLVLAACM